MFKEVPIARCLRLAFSGGVAGLALASLPALAQDVQRGERVEVTGSSIKRIDAETALPVTVIKREDLDKLGVTTAAELLDRISSNNGQGYNATLAIGDAARPGFSGASLRGLGSTNTLILLNGRRLAVYAFDGGGVNLSSIPIAALERVEILRDGASAIYGTDAIAGVINFITRKDYQGGTIEAGYYSTDSKGGNSRTGTVTLGYGDLAKNGFNVFGVFDYRKQDAIAANQRTFSRTAFIREEGVNRLSSNSVPANILTSAGLQNPYANKFQGGNGCNPPTSFGTSPTDARCRFDYASVIDIFNPTESASALFRATFQLNANNQLFAEYLHSENRSKFRISPTPVSESTTFNTGTDRVLYPKTGKYYPGNGITPAIPGIAADSGPVPGFADIFWRSLSAGPRTDVAKEKADRGLIGAEGSGFGWDYNVGLMRTQDRVTDSYVDGYLSESRLLRTGGLTPKQPGYSAAVVAGGGIDPAINPFSVAQDAAGQAAIEATKVNQVVRVGKSTRDSIDGRASREIFNLPAGPLAIAVGGEFRREKYDDVPAPIFSSGDLIGSGGDLQPAQGSRRVAAAFTELNIPIIKNLEAGFAARFDHYSDFGNTTNPKVSLRWQPSTQLLIRASAGTGFRAPTLPELFTGVTQTNSGGAYDDPLFDSSNGPGKSRCNDNGGAQFNPNFCNAQLKIKQGGNPKLDPEKSHQYSAGFVLEPTRDVTFGADYFYIKQRQQIGIINGDTKITDYIDKFNATTRTSSSIYSGDIATKIDPFSGVTVIDFVSSQFANVAEQITKGVDISARYRLPKTEFGQLTAGIESTYLISSKSRLKGDPNFTENIGLYAIFGPVVRYKQLLSLGWDYGPYNAALYYNYQTGYTDENTNLAGNPRRVGPYETFDITGSYTAFKAVKLTLGIRNLIDRNPPFTNQNQYFQVGYDPTIGDPHGRTYYARLSYTFR